MTSHCCVRVGMPVDGPDALDVEDHRRHFGVVREPEEFVHQRDARTGGGGEGARAVPGGADHHADGGELVFGLDEGEVLRAGLRIDAQLSAEALNASISEVEGVIGYQAPTVAPANTQPSAAAVLPSMMMWPRGLVQLLDAQRQRAG